jgi:hypothetical protein
MKICNHCKIEKDISEFNKNSKSRDGHRDECKSCHKEQNARWYLKNRDALILRNREWKKNNPNKIRGSRNAWFKKRCLEDPSFKLAHNLRIRVNQAIRSNYKAGSAVDDLGCSIEEFRKHIESQFKPGMSWDNWGRWGEVWHIDHIKPLVNFDLTNRRQFMKACNYKNMQPMWCIDNNLKGAH